MDGIGRELKPRPIGLAQKARDPLTGRWPTPLLAPRAPPSGGLSPRLSVYSSYTATVNAAFEWPPNTSVGQRTSALRSIKIEKAGSLP
jgi:hypothetical protein